MDWGVDFKVHCDAGEIMPQKGSRAEIGIYGAIRRKVEAINKDHVYVKGVPIA